MIKKYFIVMGVVFFLGCSSNGENNTTQDARMTMDHLMDNFVLGVYIGSHNCDIPMDKMFQDFANRSINLLVVNWHNYKLLAPKGLCTLAGNYDIRLVCQLFYSPNKSMEENSKSIDEHIRFVNSSKDNDMVIAWSIGDEPENSHNSKNSPNYEENIIAFGKLMRQKDPKRLLYMNHMPGFRMPMYQCGEDVSGVSQFWMIDWPKGIPQLYDKTRAEIKRVTGHERFITTGIGEGIHWFREKDNDYEKYLPGTGITEKESINRSSAQDIMEYFYTAYENKTQGLMLFVYDGMLHKGYEPYSLTDKNGDDLSGKWRAFQLGSQIIRARQGWPVCRILQPIEGQKLKVDSLMPITICSFTKVKGSMLDKVICQYSIDGGVVWNDIPGAKPDLVRFTAELPDLNHDQSVLIRARAYDGSKASSWHVVRVVSRR